MKNQKTYTVDEATKILEGYCAYQERCHKEVEQKLYDLNMIPEAKEQIILHLLQHNFLNEERYSRAFVRGKFSSIPIPGCDLQLNGSDMISSGREDQEKLKTQFQISSIMHTGLKNMLVKSMTVSDMVSTMIEILNQLKRNLPTM